MTKKEFGKIVSVARKEKYLSHIDIKNKIKVQPAQMRGIETATSKYTIDSLMNVCKLLGLEVIITKIQ